MAKIDVRAKVMKAKASLVLQQPFFASLVLNMPLVESTDGSVDTMATDGKHIWYNPDWTDGLEQEEVLFVLCHETMHAALAHVFRRGEREPERWNVAADYCVNQILTDEKVGKMPSVGLLNKQLYDQGKGTAEGVYALLPEGEGKGKKPGSGNGAPMDQCRDAPSSKAEQEAQEAEWKVKVAQAAQAARMQGKLSAGLKRFVDEALRPVVDWRDVLRRFVTAKAKVEPSFARPKRRWLAEDIILPSLHGETMGVISVEVDCSGSMTPKILSAIAAEMRAIHQDVRPARSEVVYWDSEVVHHDTFDQDDEMVIEMHGGGGTMYAPVPVHLEQRDITPVCAVVFTDLYIGNFGPPPAYPVLWISYGGDQAPWGEVVKIDPRTMGA